MENSHAVAVVLVGKCLARTPEISLLSACLQQEKGVFVYNGRWHVLN